MLRTIYNRVSRSQSRERSPVRPDETTLCLVANSANERTSTDLEFPMKYLSVRITVPHIDVRRMLSDIFTDIDYICYKHKGMKTEKEHVHVLVLDVDKKDVIRMRLSRHYPGNKCHSLKGMNNGLQYGIQYASKESTVPIICGPQIFYDYVAKAPLWEHRQQKSMHSYTDVEDRPNAKLRDWILTYSNLVQQAVHYAKVNRMGESGLKTVVKDMITKTKWRPCKQMIIGGVPDFYVKDFQFRMGHASEPDMEWFCQRN